MELFEQIRREHEFGTGTIQGVARKLGVHRRMVREAVASATPARRIWDRIHAEVPECTAPNQPILIAVFVPVPAPAPPPAPAPEPVAVAAPAPRLPKTGSSLPLVGLLGLLLMGASLGLCSVRRS